MKTNLFVLNLYEIKLNSVETLLDIISNDVCRNNIKCFKHFTNILKKTLQIHDFNFISLNSTFSSKTQKQIKISLNAHSQTIYHLSWSVKRNTKTASAFSTYHNSNGPQQPKQRRIAFYDFLFEILNHTYLNTTNMENENEYIILSFTFIKRLIFHRNIWVSNTA